MKSQEMRDLKDYRIMCMSTYYINVNENKESFQTNCFMMQL